LSERLDDRSIVFARTKHGAEKLMKRLVANGFDAASIHGNKNQNQRDRAIRAFKDGKVNILVATDVAARGIDIRGVSHVYNFDLPEVAENYIHRIGRTARAGAAGEAIAFCRADEVQLLTAIERLMKISIPVASGERPEPAPRNVAKRKGRPGGRRPQSGDRAANDGGKPGHRKGGTRKPHSADGTPAKSRGADGAAGKKWAGKRRPNRRPGGGGNGQRAGAA
ncbi:MAG: C-terminal helicase domain-containing protein, partial [Pseudomonadota bacterium]